MKKYLQPLATMMVLACLPPAIARAQEPAPEPDGAITPVRIQVVLSRYQNEKKVSSMPYTLSINVGSRAQQATLRMGAKIPIRMIASPIVNGNAMPSAGPIQYQDVGTNIDCRAAALGDGRFNVGVTVDDTSVYGDDADKRSDQPSFRSFRATNSLMLRDGQTGQFTSAVDKVSGEVTRVDVTLTVVK